MVCCIIFRRIHFVGPLEGSKPIRCGENEEYNACGSSCPRSCSDLYYAQEPKFCTLQCVPGCFCKDGYYRSRNGKCVKPEKCCQRRNEHYTTCGTACPATCDFQPEICILMCVQGCFCNPGFVRRNNQTNSPCIRPKQC